MILHLLYRDIPTTPTTYPLAFSIAICQYIVMVCPYCQHYDTNVTNSRQHKSLSKIWRRRQCIRCKAVFTTYEQVAEKELPLVTGKGKPVGFSIPKLLVSIYEHLPTSSETRADDAQALATTIYHELSEGSHATLTREMIADTTYQVIRRYNAHSGLSYAVAHGLVSPDSVR